MPGIMSSTKDEATILYQWGELEAIRSPHQRKNLEGVLAEGGGNTGLDDRRGKISIMAL